MGMVDKTYSFNIRIAYKLSGKDIKTHNSIIHHWMLWKLGLRSDSSGPAEWPNY